MASRSTIHVWWLTVCQLINLIDGKIERRKDKYSSPDGVCDKITRCKQENQIISYITHTRANHMQVIVSRQLQVLHKQLHSKYCTENQHEDVSASIFAGTIDQGQQRTQVSVNSSLSLSPTWFPCGNITCSRFPSLTLIFLPPRQPLMVHHRHETCLYSLGGQIPLHLPSSYPCCFLALVSSTWDWLDQKMPPSSNLPDALTNNRKERLTTVHGPFDVHFTRFNKRRLLVALIKLFTWFVSANKLSRKKLHFNKTSETRNWEDHPLSAVKRWCHSIFLCSSYERQRTISLHTTVACCSWTTSSLLNWYHVSSYS